MKTEMLGKENQVQVRRPNSNSSVSMFRPSHLTRALSELDSCRMDHEIARNMQGDKLLMS